MAAGVPVASFDCASGPREIIQHEVNGLLVTPESQVGMAAALLRLATDEDLRRRLGDAALRSSRQYDADTIAERWVGIFAAARSRRRRGTGRLTAMVAALPHADGAENALADQPTFDITGITPVERAPPDTRLGGAGRRTQRSRMAGHPRARGELPGAGRPCRRP